MQMKLHYRLVTKLRLKPPSDHPSASESSLLGGRRAAAKTASKAEPAKTCFIRCDIGFRRCLVGASRLFILCSFSRTDRYAVPSCVRGASLASIQRPQRERSDVFHEDPITRDGRLSPGRAVRDDVPFQWFESTLAAPRHDQLGVVVQKQEKIACLDDGGIRGLAGLTEPENLAGDRIEREELPSRF